MIFLFLFTFIIAVIAIVGAKVRRLHHEFANLYFEVQALRDQLAERNQDLEPCIGFVFEQSDEDELDVYQKKRR